MIGRSGWWRRRPVDRVQVKLMIEREAGEVRWLQLAKVPTASGATTLTSILELDRAGAMRLVELVKALEHIPVEGGTTVRVDDWLLEDLFRIRTTPPTCTAGSVTWSALMPTGLT